MTRRSTAHKPRAEAPGLGALTRLAHLRAIDLVRLSASRAHEHAVGGELVWPQGVDAAVELTVMTPKEPSAEKISFVIGISAKWTKGSFVLAQIEAAFRVAYDFTELKIPPTEELLSHFVRQIALHHAWPFLREKVRVASAELGVPVLLLPIKHFDGLPGEKL